MEAETAFASGTASPGIRHVEVPLGGVSVGEFLESGALRTVSHWAVAVASRELPGNGRLHGLLDFRFAGWRIGDLLNARWSLNRCRAPSVTELATFAVAMPSFKASVVAPVAYRVRSGEDALWVAYVCDALLGMWPVDSRLPMGSALLLVRE